MTHLFHKLAHSICHLPSRLVFGHQGLTNVNDWADRAWQNPEQGAGKHSTLNTSSTNNSTHSAQLLPHMNIDHYL
jgi:hypothetical protein